MLCTTGEQEVAGSTLAEVGNILLWGLIMKYLLCMVILSFPLIQVSGERMCTILAGPLGEPLKTLILLKSFKTFYLAEKPIKTFILMRRRLFLAICKCKRRTE